MTSELKEIWYVRGDDEFACPALFSLKEYAEARARELFPHETESQRYARVFYTQIDKWRTS